MASSDARKRGRLKVFLGYAAGVGKTYQMLTEAHELKRRGVDIVIAYFEPHGRKETIALSQDLETLPRKVVEYRGSRFEEMAVIVAHAMRDQSLEHAPMVIFAVAALVLVLFLTRIT